MLFTWHLLVYSVKFVSMSMINNRSQITAYREQSMYLLTKRIHNPSCSMKKKPSIIIFVYNLLKNQTQTFTFLLHIYFRCIYNYRFMLFITKYLYKSLKMYILELCYYMSLVKGKVTTLWCSESQFRGWWGVRTCSIKHTRKKWTKMLVHEDKVNLLSIHYIKRLKAKSGLSAFINLPKVYFSSFILFHCANAEI